MGNFTLTETEAISFGLSLSASTMSLCGCIATIYMVKNFRGLLSWSLLLMNLTSMLGSIFSAVMAIHFANTHGPLQFFASLFGNSSIIIYMIQVMYRSWILPAHNVYFQALQWTLFTMSAIPLSVTIVFSIPTSLNNIVYGGDAFSILLGIGGGITILLDIANSIYVIVIITWSRMQLSTKGNYNEFLNRRLPVLVVSSILGVCAIIFVLIGFSNSYDVANFIISFIEFLSIYYYSDLKDFIYRNTSYHSKPSTNDRHAPQAKDENVSFDMAGNITTDSTLQA